MSQSTELFVKIPLRGYHMHVARSPPPPPPRAMKGHKCKSMRFFKTTPKSFLPPNGSWFHCFLRCTVKRVKILLHAGELLGPARCSYPWSSPLSSPSCSPCPVCLNTCPSYCTAYPLCVVLILPVVVLCLERLLRCWSICLSCYGMLWSSSCELVPVVEVLFHLVSTSSIALSSWSIVFWSSYFHTVKMAAKVSRVSHTSSWAASYSLPLSAAAADRISLNMCFKMPSSPLLHHQHTLTALRRNLLEYSLFRRVNYFTRTSLEEH